MKHSFSKFVTTAFEETPVANRRGFLSGAAGVAGLALAGASQAAEPDPRRATLGRLKLIDLSVAIENDAPGETQAAKIEYINHKDSARNMSAIFGATPDDLVYSMGEGWAGERVSLGTHQGTHIDAPYHYGATSGGKPAKTIDEVPLEWCFGPGVLINMHHKKPGDLISSTDLAAALAKIKHKIQPGDIVLLDTGTASRWGTKEYFKQPGLDRESTLWLVNQGVHVIGIDAWTLDRSLEDMKADFNRTHDGHAIWPAHFAGLTQEYCQIEKLYNLEKIPQPTGFYVSCLPIKIKGASGGWCRAVALVPT